MHGKTVQPQISEFVLFIHAISPVECRVGLALNNH